MGVAFGVTIAFTNAGLVVAPITFGYLVDFSGYTTAILSVILFEVVGLVVALLLWWVDVPKVLDMPSTEAGVYAHHRHNKVSTEEEEELQRIAKEM